MKKSLIITILVLSSAMAFAQKAQVKQGNKLYQEQKYKEAAAAYQKSLEKDPKYAPGAFNLGNALYRQKNYDGARQALTTTTKVSKDKNVTANANYNIGNSYMEEKKWEEAVTAYKEALRKNPQDEQAKYNLSYAMAKLKKEQEDKKKDKQKQDQNQDQDKDQKDKDKGKGDDQKEKDQQQKDQQQNKDEQKDQKDQQQQPQPGKLSKEQADQLLNALSQEEKKLHDKKEKGKAIRVKVEKDW